MATCSYWDLIFQKTLAINEKELCKYFEPGNHVKVVSGTQEGATGMVVKVEQHVLIILSDVTKEHVSIVFLCPFRSKVMDFRNSFLVK